MKRLLSLLLAASLLVPFALALSGTTPLLAVRLNGEQSSGSLAELKLEIQPGAGRVFVDTFPLSKVETQMSMRFAKEVACDFLGKDCSKIDFIYTIHTDSPIIGGPSAGASATVLTIALLSSIDLPQDIAMTGTINSGGLVGPVGGLKEKIEAARAAGLSTVLVPRGEHLVNASNLTLEEFGANMGILIKNVDTIQDALEIMLPGKFQAEDATIATPDSYKQTMRHLAEDLCNRTTVLERSVPHVDDAINLSNRADSHFAKEQYYASASFCFGANIKFNEAFLREKNFSVGKYLGLMDELEKEIASYERTIDAKEIRTLTDLESFMVVKERLLEARQSLNATNETYPYAYAYANERLRSAGAWAQFLKHEGNNINLDEASLEATCGRKLGEAEERIQYLSITSEVPLAHASKALADAYADLDNGDLALCIFRASRAKAEANILLTALSIGAEDVPAIVESKLNAANRVIAKGSRKGMFPILGYSYYEYAQTLKENDLMSAMLYAEYALELGDLQIYFRPSTKVDLNFQAQDFLVLGILLGWIAGFLTPRRNV